MKIGVIGYGSIGARHAQNAARFSDDVTVFDADPSKSDMILEKGFKVADDLDSFFRSGFEAVVVASPHNTHIDLATRSVEAGSHVLIEKPLSHSLDGVQDFVDLAKNKGKQVYVVCNMRFHPAVSALRDNLGKIGKPLFARAQYGNYLPNMRPDADYSKLYCAHRDQGGGVILDAIHELDYLSWFFGSIEKITCTADRLSDLDIDVEDYAALNLRHKSGVYSEVHLDYLQQFKRRGCEIVGTDGTLIWTSEGKNPESCHVRLFSKEGEVWETLYENGHVDLQEPYLLMMEAFIKSLHGEDGPSDLLLNVKDAVTVLKSALSCQAS